MADLTVSGVREALLDRQVVRIERQRDESPERLEHDLSVVAE